MQNCLILLSDKFFLLLKPRLHVRIIFHFHHGFTTFWTVLLLAIMTCDCNGPPTERVQVCSWTVKPQT